MNYNQKVKAINDMRAGYTIEQISESLNMKKEELIKYLGKF